MPVRNEARDAGSDATLPNAAEPSPPDAAPAANAAIAPDAAAPLDTRCGTPASAVQCSESLLGHDELYRILLADLEAQRPEDQPFTRYVGLVNRRNAGVCGAALDTERWAMNKLLNSVSTEFEIALPEAIDAEQTIYRIDIRRYGWDRLVEMDGANFNDGWEAIISTSPYAIEFQGGAAARLAQSMLTFLPYLNLDALLDVAGFGSVYYALIDAGSGEQPNVYDIERAWDIDLSANLARPGVVKAAGFRGSSVSTQPRVVQRHPFAADRVYWMVLDLDPEYEANDSIFADPLGFAYAGGFSIVSLPNLLHGYLAWAADGRRLDTSSFLFDTSGPIRSAVSCMGCHLDGIVPVVDQVRAYVDANPTNYAPEEATAIQELYVPAVEMNAAIATDQRVYQAATLELGIPLGCGDPVSALARRFERPLTLQDALADLGVTRAAFEAALPRLEPSMAGLLNVGQLERASFTGLYAATLCAVIGQNGVDAGATANVPSAAFCEAALSQIQ